MNLLIEATNTGEFSDLVYGCYGGCGRKYTPPCGCESAFCCCFPSDGFGASM